MRASSLDSAMRAKELDAAMRAVLGIAGTEVIATDAIVKEFLRLRTFSPRAFQAAILIIMSTLLVTGDTRLDTSPEDLSSKLERMTALQKQITEFAAAEADARLSEIRSALGLHEEDETIPKEKLN